MTHLKGLEHDFEGSRSHLEGVKLYLLGSEPHLFWSQRQDQWKLKRGFGPFGLSKEGFGLYT